MNLLKVFHRFSAIDKKKRKRLSLMITAHVIACLLLFSLAALAFGIQKNFIHIWQGKESITTISIVGTEIKKE